MIIKINGPIEIRRSQLEKYNYIEHGNDFEKIYWKSIKNNIKNLEEFWRYFIVPTTKRIIPGEDSIDHRIDIEEKVIKLGVDSLWIFKHLIYAQEYLNFRRVLSFEYFYIHLASVCDLIESVCLRVAYFLGLNLGKFKEEEKYIKDAKNYYNKFKDTSNIIEYYLDNDNYPRWDWNLFEIEVVLNELIPKLEIIKEYLQISGLIKAYRNTIIHKSGFTDINKSEKVLVPSTNNLKELRIKTHSKDFIKGIKNNDKFEEVSSLTNRSCNTLYSVLNEILDEIRRKMDYAMLQEPQNRLLGFYNIKIVKED